MLSVVLCCARNDVSTLKAVQAVMLAKPLYETGIFPALLNHKALIAHPMQHSNLRLSKGSCLALGRISLYWPAEQHVHSLTFILFVS